MIKIFNKNTKEFDLCMKLFKEHGADIDEWDTDYIEFDIDDYYENNSEELNLKQIEKSVLEVILAEKLEGVIN
jgi:hypothetical protein